MYDYAIEWTPEYVALYINGLEFQKTEAPHPGVTMQNKPMNVMLNFWAPRSDAHISDFNQDWSKGMDDSKMPFYATFEDVQVFRYDEKYKNFQLEWTEDFSGTSLDETKWTVAENVGWDQNLSTFYSSQYYVKDNKLTLVMEHTPSPGKYTPSPGIGPSFLALSQFLN